MCCHQRSGWLNRCTFLLILHDAGKIEEKQETAAVVNLSAASFITIMMSAGVHLPVVWLARSRRNFINTFLSPSSLSFRQIVWEASPAGPTLHHVAEVLAEDGAHRKLRHPHDVPRCARQLLLPEVGPGSEHTGTASSAALFLQCQSFKHKPAGVTLHPLSLRKTIGDVC